MKSIFHYFSTFLAFFCIPYLPIDMSAQDIDLNADAVFGATRARHIGPAVMSGRISDIAQHPSDANTLLVGAAGGGVWKSVNGGTIFSSIFDDHTQCIGAVAFDPTDPDRTYWVGTGEVWTRNSVSIGDGIYVTKNGGSTWKHMGLDNSERITSIYVHPDNGDVVYVGVLGALWSDSEERGVYKTEDGGESWEKILYVDARTGCADLVMDPKDPNILYASMWTFRRTAWSFHSGGPESSLFKSLDGGKTWEKIHNGFPSGDLGRIAVAVAPSNSNIIYATIESEDPSKSGLYRSDDSGASWQHLNNDFEITIRPFYFSRIVVHPTNPDIIFKAGLRGAISRDGGKTFSTPGAMHADIHDAVFDHKNPDKIYFGNDGGVNISMDKGQSTFFVDNLPVSQFYHISVDNQSPYRIYGGLQDNGSWIGPSYADGGIRGKHWLCVGVGDGFRVYPHPTNPDIVYSEMQGAENVWRQNIKTKQIRTITPTQFEGEPDLRFNWNASLTTSPNEPNRIYIGSQFVHKSDDMGDNWVKISPDLTTNDPSKYDNDNTGGLTRDKSGAENHCTIFTIAESPKDETVIWAGTDDGQVQITNDGGKNWTNVTSNIPGLPANTWCYHIEASVHNPAIAYAVFDGHTHGDMSTYVYKTNDYGSTWTSISTEDIKGFARAIQEDLFQPGLLYLGTEFGLYISLNDGQKWYYFDKNFPPVAIHYLTMSHDGDLVAGTHGRGIIIVDQLDALRQLNSDVLNEDIYFFPNDTFRFVERNTFEGYEGNTTEFVGENASNKISLVYYMKKRPLFGRYSLKIYDDEGTEIVDIPPSKRKGINLVQWDGFRSPPKMAKGKVFSFYGFTKARVPAGKYTAVLENNKTRIEHPFVIAYPETSIYSIEERKLQEETTMVLYNLCEDVAYLVYQIDETSAWLKKYEEDISAKNSLYNDLQTLKKKLVVTTGNLYTDAEEVKLRGEIAELYSKVAQFYGAPSDDHLRDMEDLKTKVDSAVESYQDIVTSKDYNKVLKQLSDKEVEAPKLMSKSEYLED